MPEKRKRAQNFTIEEKDRLLKLLMQDKETILNKKTDGTANEAKCKAWITLTESFNTTGPIYRSRHSLMKMWEKLKSESKIYYAASRNNFIQTGGEPSVIKKTDPMLEQICAILGRPCTGIKDDPDSNFTENVSYRVESTDNSSQLSPKFIHIDLPRDTNIEPQDVGSHENIGSEEVVRKPLWSRRRPTLHHPNKRTEDLKRQILLDEIQFKKKLYDLQLQSAAHDLEFKKIQLLSATKEYEIKNEILQRIKGCTLPLTLNLFGAQQMEEK